jgi:hypothetical protein
VRITSDWTDTEVIRHLGTSYGSGYVGGRAATVTTVHLERLCRTPCSTSLPTEGTYYADAPGMQAREFRLPAETKSLKVRVTGASSTPLALSYWATLLGGTAALTGGILWGVFGSMDGTSLSRTDAAGNVQSYREPYDTSAYRTLTLVGGGVMIAGIVGLVLLPRTHVETDSGVRLDASASSRSASPSRVRFTGSGFVF